MNALHHLLERVECLRCRGRNRFDMVVCIHVWPKGLKQASINVPNEAPSSGVPASLEGQVIQIQCPSEAHEMES